MADHYNGAELLACTSSQRNRNVFGGLLHELTESIARMSARSWFHALGPNTTNDQAPKYRTLGWWRGRNEW